jgi:protein phosphatase
VEVDVEGPFPVHPGDRYLLCSDGLTGLVKDEEIGMLLGSMNVEDAAQALVALALLRGGSDNITVLVVQPTGANDKLQESDEGQTHENHFSLSANATQMLLASLIGFSLVVALAMLAHGQPLLAAASFIIGLVAAGTVWVVKVRGSRQRAASKPQGRPSQAPYRKVVCQPNAEFVRVLAEDVARVRQVALENKFSIDWDRVDASMRDAESAATGGHHELAIQQYTRAGRTVIEELRPYLDQPWYENWQMNVDNDE